MFEILLGACLLLATVMSWNIIKFLKSHEDTAKFRTIESITPIVFILTTLWLRFWDRKSVLEVNSNIHTDRVFYYFSLKWKAKFDCSIIFWLFLYFWYCVSMIHVVYDTFKENTIVWYWNVDIETGEFTLEFSIAFESNSICSICCLIRLSIKIKVYLQFYVLFAMFFWFDGPFLKWNQTF